MTGFIKIEDSLYLIKRQINPSYFQSSKDPKKLVGMWVEYLGCDRVVENNGKYLFCQTIEEAVEL